MLRRTPESVLESAGSPHRPFFRGKYVGMRQDEARGPICDEAFRSKPSSSILWIALDLDHSRFFGKECCPEVFIVHHCTVVNRSDTLKLTCANRNGDNQDSVPKVFSSLGTSQVIPLIRL